MSLTELEPPSLPRSIVSCIPLVWRRVLFPGSSHVAPARIGAVLLLVIVPGLLLYPCLSFLLFEPDEGRYAEIPREMLTRGEWVVPHLLGEPYLDKPPLLYWLVICSYGLFGVHDWAARLVPALAVHAAILVVYLLGRRSVGERAAFWAALLLALCPGFLSVGRLLVLDGLLALWVTIALLTGFEALRTERIRWEWGLIAASAAGLGVLTKGPIAVVLLLPPLLMNRWLLGQSLRIGWRAWFIFAAVVLAINLPWYVAVCVRLPEFAAYFFWQHNVLRFVAPFDHIEPVWYYGPILLAGLLPGTLVAVAWFRFYLSSDASAAERRSSESGFFLLAGVWCVLFFSMSGSKLPTYVLPAFPCLALAFGAFFAGSRWASIKWTRAVVPINFALLAVAHYAVIPWYAEFRSPMSRPEVVAEYCADSPVVCYPRNCDSVAFYLGRDDFRNYRSKETPDLVEWAHANPRTVVLFTHRHSPFALGPVLEAKGMALSSLTPISRSWTGWFKEAYCYMGVIENPHPQPAAAN